VRDVGQYWVIVCFSNEELSRKSYEDEELAIEDVIKSIESNN
jgi:hypothetical protein